MTTTVYNPASPPIYGSAWSFDVVLRSQADTKLIQTSVTLAAGDVLIYLDGVLDGNIDTLPVEIGASGVLVVTMSIAEMTAGRTLVKFHDQDGGQWVDDVFEIFPVVAAAVGTSDLTAGAQMDIVNAPNATGVSVFSAANWNYQSSMMTVAGSIGKWIIDHLDALISSRAAAGDQMDLVDAPNSTAITAIQAGLAQAGDQMDLVNAPNSTALTAISTANWTFAGAAGRTLTSLGTLLNSIPQAIWEYARRTLTQTAAQVAAATAGPNLAVTRFCTFENEFENLTIPATWQVMWLTAKRSKKDRDANAQFMVRVTNGGAASDGGQYYNRTAASTTQRAYASLTVDQPGGKAALLIKDEGTALLADGSYHYDIKYLETDGSIHQLAGEADFEIDSSYTQAVV